MGLFKGEPLEGEVSGRNMENVFALCHKLMFGQSWHKCPSQAGTVKKTAAVLLTAVFFP